MLEGENSLIVDSRLQGHQSNSKHSGADISIFQDAEWRGTTVTIKNTVMESPRDVLFGFPFNNKSFIKIEGYRGVVEENLLLFKLDSEPPEECNYWPDMQYVANVCILEQETPSQTSEERSTENSSLLRPWMRFGFKNIGLMAAAN